MLFDLRARGRRRTVQVVYVGLALLFVVGFIGFGVGGGFGGGGVLEGLIGREGGQASFASQVATAEKRVRAHPGEAEAWAKLVEAKYHQASESDFLNQSTGKFTDKGKALLAEVASDWNHYMALNPSKPNLTAAQDMLGVFAKEALNQPASAVQVLQQVVIPAKPPSAALYGELAVFAYQANNMPVGDLASKKAVSLAPAAQRARVKEQLARVKTNPSGNPENEKYTGTVGGKTYNFKQTTNGKFIGKPAPPSTSAPKPTTPPVPAPKK
jgi:hypothetical protein